MNSRHLPRNGASRAAAPAPVHRGPQALSPAQLAPGVFHAPNAALLIDFDNVTLGIQKDLGKELRNLLSSDIIKGKVSVQRAYADWRRYPQYIVPLAESSIDLIFAPAYGSSKKNATDIRLAIDALELVFTRPEIGTFILLSGDSDFSSLVLKLKEYGKYVIGVGIRESASDLLVQNCDEYYSYNALAGLSKASDEVSVKRDPWELVVEAIAQMKRNGDVMRSDRLKQVMQELDASFDEKDLGYSKFSRFCLDAAGKGLLSVNKLENGQFEVAPAGAAAGVAPAPLAAPAAESREEREERGRRGRGRRGRGRGRDRDEREPREEGDESGASSLDAPSAPAAPAAPAAPTIGVGGERLTRDEAFDLVRRATEALVSGDATTDAPSVRARAFELLGRDSESLSERNFPRILKDVSDAGMIVLRVRGDDYEIARAATPTIASPLNTASAAHATGNGTPAAPPARGALGNRGMPGRGRPGRPLPPELLAIGVVEDTPLVTATTAAPEPVAEPEAVAPVKERRAAPRGKAAAKVAERPAAKTAPKAAAKKKSAPARADAAPKKKAAKKKSAE